MGKIDNDGADKAVPGRTRRSVIRVAALLGLAAAPVTVAGCDLLDRDPEPAPEPDPIAPLITTALDLAIRYDAAVAAFPELAARLAPVAEAHRAHATELARVIGTPLPSGTGPGGGAAPGGTAAPAGADQAATLAALRAAEQDGRQSALDICLAVPAGRAALVGSVAAARATHLEVLR